MPAAPPAPFLRARFGGRWSDGVCAAGGALAGGLLVESQVGSVASAISDRLARPPAEPSALKPYVGFLVVVAAALVGASLAVVLQAWLERRGERWVAPISALLAASAMGAWRAPWLAFAVPMSAIAIAPLLVVGRVREVAVPKREKFAAIACIASEGACFGAGAWLPFAKAAPGLLLLAMLLPAAAAAYGAAFRANDAARARCAGAGLPLLLLPFVGLLRNPTLATTAAGLCVAGLAWAWLGSSTRPAETAKRWSQRHGIVLALPAVALVFVLPWHFRDLPHADFQGHEGQHLGWINSIAFGKLMMADAGFTYGPVREYALAALAWLMGGVTLEHVRLAHVAVNVVGMVCLFAAMHRVCAGQLHTLLIGFVLLLTHTALTSLVAYTTTISFGWADASRAGLATLAVVVVLSRRRRDARAGRRGLIGGGALGALAMLYSHDFGLPAVLATLAGMAADTLFGSVGGVRERARDLLRDGGTYALGLAIVLVPFLAVYAARGRLRALFEGYGWAMAVNGGATLWRGVPYKLGEQSFDSWSALTAPTDPEAALGARVLDYLIAPAIAALGLVHATTAVLRRRFVQRTTVVCGLAALQTMTLRHAFLRVDTWHVANAATPGLVLLVALASGGRRLFVRTRAGRALPVGVALAGILPVVWVAHGGWVPVGTRLSRVASGDERPSVGAPYRYDDLPRAGDVRVGDVHLTPVRYVREHSRPDEPVLFMIGELGGGCEAFLSERRNPISFDKPDEIATSRLRGRAWSELRSDPPALLVGGDSSFLGDDARRFVRQGWHAVSPGIEARNP